MPKLILSLSSSKKKEKKKQTNFAKFESRKRKSKSKGYKKHIVGPPPTLHGENGEPLRHSPSAYPWNVVVQWVSDGVFRGATSIGGGYRQRGQTTNCCLACLLAVRSRAADLKTRILRVHAPHPPPPLRTTINRPEVEPCTGCSCKIK
jgi:hypothetical protein